MQSDKTLHRNHAAYLRSFFQFKRIYLYADLRAGKMPNFSFIAPNQCHDMHGTGNSGALCAYEPNPTLVQMGDASVQERVTEIKKSDAWRDGKNAIVVLWDENSAFFQTRSLPLLRSIMAQWVYRAADCQTQVDRGSGGELWLPFF
ncbi:alkaline phosphatase family protein [Candidatus Nitrotoga arctica]|uniref:Uncharacterized protein n=1 Tax=Candidatus Nitrotoga arctica TaxID=453162 RepID=A0ABM8YV32_9PROT|nr:alkaline phosphatase family protein [Candidatus Nitrotoga arctica]CAG9931304.1 protein of unknown function [Candidatus Nitrotoga arctica]